MLKFPHEHTIERIVWSRDRNGKYADRLALEYVIEVANDSDDWVVVADSTDRRSGDPAPSTHLTLPTLHAI